MEANLLIKDWFEKEIKPKYPNIHISCAYRNAAEQNKAFAQHRSALTYPLSAHNKENNVGQPLARALDLFVLNDEGKAEFPQPVFKEIASTLNPGAMKWGGNFKHLGDADHFQLV
jgi:hypothetical protein